MKFANHSIAFFWISLIALAFLPSCGSIKAIHAALNSPSEIISQDRKEAATATITAKAANLVIIGKPSIAHVVQVQSKLMIATGVLCILTAVALFYFQMYFMAIKLFLAGIVLPIFAIWFQNNWGWVIAGALISIALIAYAHWKVVLQPIVAAASKDIDGLVQHITNHPISETYIQKKI